MKEKKNVVPQTDDDNVNDTPVVISPPVDTTKKVDTPIVANNGITVTGGDEMTVGAYGAATLNLNVKCDSCNGDELFLSVDDPNNPNLELGFTKESGYSDFNTEFVVKSYFAKWGKYNLTITATDRKGKKVSYVKKLNIDGSDKFDCNRYFLKATDDGYFDQIRHISNATINGTINIDTLLPWNWKTQVMNNEPESNIYLRNVVVGWSQTLQNYLLSYKPNSDYHLLINYNCWTGGLSIPEQIVEGQDGGQKIYVTVTGSGKLNLTNRTFEIEYVCKFKEGNTTVYQTFKLIDKLKEL